MAKKHPKTARSIPFLTLGILVATSIVWSWLWFINVAKLSSDKVTGFITIAVVFSLIVGISTYGFYLTVRYLKQQIRQSSPLIAIAKIAAVWAFAELAISWLVSIIWMGSQGSWDSVLPFASTSFIVIHTPLKYLARLVGFYGLSGITMAAIATLVVKRLRSYALPVWSVVILLSLIGYWWPKTTSQPIKATIVAEHLGSNERLRVSGSQLIVLPEYGLDYTESQPVSSRLVVPENEQTYFVGTKQQAVDKGLQNLLLFGNTSDGIVSQIPKTRLIPGGEYLAYTVAPLLKSFDPTTYSDFEVRRAVIKGDIEIKPFRVSQQLVIGSGACSSIIATKDYRKLTREGATVLTNSASLDIFNGSGLFNWQQRSLAQFIAVANARSFLQSANDANGYAINGNGQEVAHIAPSGLRSVMVSTNSRQTPYTILGEWVAILGGLVLALDTYNFVRQRHHKDRHGIKRD